ncbi:MAG: hypothetical protein R3253_11100, partial [Longimicrobiales bacterium]|nr:hypothetical protein [Longimicrobiales bacterium]
MATRGFLIRFIDIGLIVLFGFLMISDIEASSRVELAGSGDAAEEEVEPEEAPALVVVEIAGDGAFLVGMPAEVDASGGDERTGGDVSSEAADSAADLDAGGMDDVVRLRMTDVTALEDALRTAARTNELRGRSTVVVIEPSPASAVQRT